MRYDMVRGHHASSSSRGSLWISGAFRGTPVQYTGGPIFLLGCLSLPPAVYSVRIAHGGFGQDPRASA